MVDSLTKGACVGLRSCVDPLMSLQVVFVTEERVTWSACEGFWESPGPLVDVTPDRSLCDTQHRLGEDWSGLERNSGYTSVGHLDKRASPL